MPTVLKIGKYRFFFYSNEFGEPPHIHIQHDNKLAKFWLLPIKLEKSIRFSSKELNTIKKMIEKNKDVLMGAWDEYFDTK